VTQLFPVIFLFNIREKAGRAGTTGESAGYYKGQKKPFMGQKISKKKKLEMEAT